MKTLLKIFASAWVITVAVLVVLGLITSNLMLLNIAGYGVIILVAILVISFVIWVIWTEL